MNSLFIITFLLFIKFSSSSFVYIGNSNSNMQLRSKNNFNEIITKPTCNMNLINLRGGGKQPLKIPNSDVKTNYIRNILTGWGVVQVLSILANAVKRLLPIALQPFKQNDLNIYHWSAYLLWSIYMAYAEGYQAFQLKFSPLVVKRAYGLIENQSLLNLILAGPWSMGLFGATKKRMIVSWGISVGVFGLIAIVKKLPYPYRSIVDAGVVVGLSWGMTSIIYQFIKTIWTGKPPDVDPCLNEKSINDKKK